MSTIWKFSLPLLSETQDVKAPGLGRLLTVAMQNGVPTLWAEVDEGERLRHCTITMCGTGHPVPPGEYIATVFDGPFVWHYFATPVTASPLGKDTA